MMRTLIIVIGAVVLTTVLSFIPHALFIGPNTSARTPAHNGAQQQELSTQIPSSQHQQHEQSLHPTLPILPAAQIRTGNNDTILDQHQVWLGEDLLLRQSLIATEHLSGLHVLYREYWRICQQHPHLQLEQEYWQVAEQLLLRVDYAPEAAAALHHDIPELQLRALDGTHSLLARFPIHSAQCFEQWQQRLQQHPQVLSSEADTLLWFTGNGDASNNEEDDDTVIPNDPAFPDQWALRNTVQTPGGQSGADISATEAWSITTGSADIVVAIIDTGVHLQHEDLVDTIWKNPLETVNGEDDSGNGKVDDVHGWNFADDNNDITDADGHGTHIAGIISASGNNGIGIAGISWHSQLMALKVGEGTSFPVSRAIQAIAYADAQGAQLVNMSWATTASNSSLRDAIAQRPHILFAAAAGNDGADIDDSPVYPAAYRFDHLLAVTATTASDTVPSFSNTGVSSVHIAAPGASILSTWPENEGSDSIYAFSSGTSMAVPHVLGVAALLLAEDPTRSPYDVRSIIMLSGDPLAPLHGTTISGRRLNAFTALTTLQQWPQQPRRIGGLRVWEDGTLRSVTVEVEQNGLLHYEAKTTTHDIGGLQQGQDVDIVFPLDADA
ncbi:MAG: hypothetical protein EA401_03860 [Planctomycetota bacterium]|nr:MAG: hypothetical protein EA401_03860 [Planctomycetota bacterium]